MVVMGLPQLGRSGLCLSTVLGGSNQYVRGVCLGVGWGLFGWRIGDVD
ncbi:MAG: hypothetical protein QW688_04400 [Thermoprotei archaeon]